MTDEFGGSRPTIPLPEDILHVLHQDFQFDHVDHLFQNLYDKYGNDVFTVINDYLQTKGVAPITAHAAYTPQDMSESFHQFFNLIDPHIDKMKMQDALLNYKEQGDKPTTQYDASLEGGAHNVILHLHETGGGYASPLPHALNAVDGLHLDQTPMGGSAHAAHALEGLIPTAHSLTAHLQDTVTQHMDPASSTQISHGDATAIHTDPHATVTPADAHHTATGTDVTAVTGTEHHTTKGGE